MSENVSKQNIDQESCLCQEKWRRTYFLVKENNLPRCFKEQSIHVLKIALVCFVYFFLVPV